MKQLLILLMLVSQPAWAEWVKTAEATRDGFSFDVFWDPATLRKTAANTRRAWTMSNYASKMQTSDGRIYQSVRRLYEYDCADGKLRILQQDVFSGAMLSGDILPRLITPTSWMYPAPKSVGELELTGICNVPLQ